MFVLALCQISSSPRFRVEITRNLVVSSLFPPDVFCMVFDAPPLFYKFVETSFGMLKNIFQCLFVLPKVVLHFVSKFSRLPVWCLGVVATVPQTRNFSMDYQKKRGKQMFTK